MIFERKAFALLRQWKEQYSDRYACLLEGARRVGKSTIAENFAKRNYDSYILIDFTRLTPALREVFDDLSDLDLFFRRLQLATGVELIPRRSVIIFDEIQRMPKAREAIKYLVADGRYSYIETGSLISIRKNVRDIVLPSEEMRISVYPLDYEEFCWATGRRYELLKDLAARNRPLGAAINRKLTRDFRLYMAVGGMPQAVEAYIEGKSFRQIDAVKREIIRLYRDDFRKIDPSGRLSALYDAIPAQLARNSRRFVLTAALKKRKITEKDEELLADLLDSKTVLPCYNVSDPSILLPNEMDATDFKLYLSDVGLFTTMIFNNRDLVADNLYSALLSDKLPANLGYLYENAVAQIITSTGRKLFFHTWRKKDSPHSYEIDFLLTSGAKLIPIEVKSSQIRNRASIDEFGRKYARRVARRILFSQDDFGREETLELKPIYLAPIIIEDIEK